jgi:hypothetical protein
MTGNPGLCPRGCLVDCRLRTSRPFALNDSWYAHPGLWGYSAAFLAFAWAAARLIGQWRPGGKPAMLLAMTVATAFASAAAAFFAVVPSDAAWQVVSVLDFGRSCATLGFLLAYLGVRDETKGTQRGGSGRALLVGVGVVLLASQSLSGIEPPRSGSVRALAPDRHDIRLSYAKALLKAGRAEEARKELTRLESVSQDSVGKSEVAGLLRN